MQAPRYPRLWLIGLIACLIALVYWPSTVFLRDKWADVANKSYTHGWLILAICVALVIRSRRELTTMPARPSGRALLALTCATVAWLVCYRASIEGLEVPLQPVLFWLAVAAAFGWGVARLLLFPVAYFYFAVPIWYGTPLKDLTVLVMRGVLALTGPPTLIEGDVIHIPNGNFIIEEGCSGLHFMIVGLAIAALYGEQQRDPWRTRLLQLALMAGLALIANWVRVYTVIEAGYLTNMQSYLVRVSHYGFGWCVFGVALLVFFWLARRLEPATALPYDSAHAPPTPGAQSLRPELTGFAVAVAVLVALPAVSAGVRMMHPPPRTDTVGPGDPRADWREVPVDVRSAWQPVFAGADELRRQAFGNAAGDTIEVLTVAYRVQRQGAELVGESSSILGDGLQSRAEQVVQSPGGAFRELEVADSEESRSLIWWRYDIGGRKLVGPFEEQLWYGINALVWSPPAGLVALRTACHPECNQARRTLREFIASSDVR